MKRIWLIILCLANGVSISAQQLLLTKYSMHEGLVSNDIRCVFQDKKGFLWIGTMDGLSIYDGYRFQNFTMENGLDHNHVNDFLEMDDGTIFVAFNNGSVVRFYERKIVDVARGKVIINKFFKTSWGKTLVATDVNGVQEFEKGLLVKPEKAHPDRNYYSIAETKDGLLVLGSNSAIVIMDRTYEVKQHLDFQDHSLAENRPCVDNDGKIWTNRLPYFGLVDMEKGAILPSSLQIPELKQNVTEILLKDKRDNIWVPSPEGIVCISADLTPTVYKTASDEAVYKAKSLFEDRQQNIWIGTTQGLYRFNAMGSVVHYHSSNGLYSNNPVQLYYDQQNQKLFIPSPYGLQVINKNTGGIKNMVKKTTPTNTVILAKSIYPTLVIDDGVYQLDPKNSSLFRIQTHASLEKFFHRGFMAPSGDAFLWNSIEFYLFNGKELQRHVSGFTDYATGMEQDPSGNLWLASWSEGLFRFKYEVNNGRLNILEKRNILDSIGIRSLLIDPNGNIWAGSRYNGLFRIKPNNDSTFTIKNWNTENGLLSNWIKSIAIDKEKNIWISSNTELYKMVPLGDDQFRVIPFSRIHNFYANIYQLVIDEDEMLWLATDNGILQTRDRKIEDQPPVDPFITSVSTNDSLYLSFEKEISLTYPHDRLRIEFSAPDYINEKQVMYSYRISGRQDNAWSEPANLHEITLESLRPGHYKFEVRTMGWNGRWSQTAVCRFYVQPAFWQHTLFLVLMALLGTAFITWLVQRRIRFIKKEAHTKQQLAETKMMALRAQMNPHFIFNSINAIDNLIQTRQADKATTYLTRFAKLIRLILDSSKNNLVSFQKEFETLQLYIELEQFRTSGKFNYSLNADPELLNSDIMVPPLLIQPFIENAIHHGLLNKPTNNRMLQIDIKLNKDYIEYLVQDNGVGRAHAEALKLMNRPEHQSYGISIATERLQLHNQGVLEDELNFVDLESEGRPAGTRVIVKLKIIEN